jgi:hypothetical protein
VPAWPCGEASRPCRARPPAVHPAAEVPITANLWTTCGGQGAKFTCAVTFAHWDRHDFNENDPGLGGGIGGYGAETGTCSWGRAGRAYYLPRQKCLTRSSTQSRGPPWAAPFSFPLPRHGMEASHIASEIRPQRRGNRFQGKCEFLHTRWRQCVACSMARNPRADLRCRAAPQ